MRVYVGAGGGWECFAYEFEPQGRPAMRDCISVALSALAKHLNGVRPKHELVRRVDFEVAREIAPFIQESGVVALHVIGKNFGVVLAVVWLWLCICMCMCVCMW